MLARLRECADAATRCWLANWTRSALAKLANLVLEHSGPRVRIPSLTIDPVVGRDARRFEEIAQLVMRELFEQADDHQAACVRDADVGEGCTIASWADRHVSDRRWRRDPESSQPDRRTVHRVAHVRSGKSGADSLLCCPSVPGRRRAGGRHRLRHASRPRETHRSG